MGFKTRMVQVLQKTIESEPVTLAREEAADARERRDSADIDTGKKFTMMALFTLRWGRLKKSKVAPAPAS